MKRDDRMHYASYYRWLVIRDWIRVNPTDRVLDVGCDDGEIIARLPAARKVGIDLNPRSPDPNVHLVCGDARRLPIASGAFDVVFAFDIIEHIEDDRTVLAELVRVLACGGTLWLSTPSAGFVLFPSFLTARANRGWGHVRNGYTIEEIQQKLPPEVQVEVLLWNEPVFRFVYVGLRSIDKFTRLTCLLARWCFEIDRHWSQGHNGHLFGMVRKEPIKTWV